MVKTVLQGCRNQWRRISIAVLQCYSIAEKKFWSVTSSIKMRKNSSKTCLFFLKTLVCITAILASGHCSLARDLGAHGVLFPIEEEDPIQLIQQKLKVIEENGELERHNHILQKKGKAAVERPKPVEGITRATQGRVFYYDPTYVVKADLVDHQGHVFYKKGTKINPLETVSLSQNLLFFDADDEEQKNFAKEKLQQGSLKLILIKGKPLALSEEFKIPVYFDQGGILTKKLGITQVPALVAQEKTRLHIQEVCLRASDPKIKREDKE
ncbi:MAG: type-F conjugative transfer system protein TraW [Alphaproteobacteria bacterium]|nr:type-F conjugative transfer system protein TraW [Alphaproteobacteria bacterium]